MEQGEITQLLERWRAGDEDVMESLAPAVYSHLHSVATAFLSRERPEHTLQATGLVHELFLKLYQTRSVQYRDRVHFYTFAAKVMRRILVDHARRNNSLKRASLNERIPLTEELAWIDAQSSDMLALDTALGELASLDEIKVQILELRFFLGTTAEETAELLGLSKTTVDRSVRFAITWLHQRMSRKSDPGG